MFAAKTTAHNRSTFQNVVMLRRASSGMIAVSVFSVNSCCRPTITIKKPSGYPRLVISGRHGTSGRYVRNRASPTNENPMESPAANPDHASAEIGRRSSSSPSLRMASCTTSALTDVRSSASCSWRSVSGGITALSVTALPFSSTSKIQPRLLDPGHRKSFPQAGSVWWKLVGMPRSQPGCASR